MIKVFQERILGAVAGRTSLRPHGGGTKDFYAETLEGEILDTRSYSGIVDYDPTELVVTVRAGTPLAELEATLAAQNQMLAFEPPHFAADATSFATVGGCIAAGLSGPRRATAGAVRDFVLGVRMLDGKGDDLNFGGRVMKNVAGYDVSRLMVGSMGTLGLLLEVSLKVIPLPKAETTLHLALPPDKAILAMNHWAGKPLPISATCYFDGVLTIRLSGAQAAVTAARHKIGGEEVIDVIDAAAFWRGIREQTHPFFLETATPLWRLSIPSTTPPLEIAGPRLAEWGGALRWLRSDANPQMIREAAIAIGGHATLFRRGTAHAASQAMTAVFHPLAPNVARLHRSLKKTFDPHGIFCPGRMYPGL